MNFDSVMYDLEIFVPTHTDSDSSLKTDSKYNLILVGGGRGTYGHTDTLDRHAGRLLHTRTSVALAALVQRYKLVGERFNIKIKHAAAHAISHVTIHHATIHATTQ